ncbi:MAG: hypothetical protein AAFV53_13970 [Myxococcota bacterium]
MKRALIALLCLGGLTMMSTDAEAGRYHRGRVHVQVRPSVTVVSPVVAPATRRVWIPAQVVFDPRLRRHVTVPGYWEVVPVARTQWVAGYYVGRGPHQRWVPGRWVVIR